MFSCVTLHLLQSKSRELPTGNLPPDPLGTSVSQKSWIWILFKYIHCYTPLLPSCIRLVPKRSAASRIFRHQNFSHRHWRLWQFVIHYKRRGMTQRGDIDPGTPVTRPAFASVRYRNVSRIASVSSVFRFRHLDAISSTQFVIEHARFAHRTAIFGHFGLRNPWIDCVQICHDWSHSRGGRIINRQATIRAKTDRCRHRSWCEVWVKFSHECFCSAPQCSHCKRCTSYSNSVRPSVRLSVFPSVCLSVCHTTVLCKNDCT